MKRIQESLGAKIGAILLVLVLAAVLVVSGLGVVVLAVENAYTDGGEQLRKTVMNEYLADMGQMVVNHYEATVEGYADTASYESWMAADHVNYRYILTDRDGKILLQSEPCADLQYERTEKYIVSGPGEPIRETKSFETDEARKKYLSYYLVQYADYSVSWATHDEVTEEDTILYQVDLERNKTVDKTVFVTGQIPAKLTARDTLSTQLDWVGRLIAAKNWLIVAALGSFVGMALLSIFLLCAAGHKAGVEGIHLTWLNRIPFDLYTAALVVAGIPPLAILMEAYDPISETVAACLLMVWWFALVLFLAVSFSARAKAGAWWQNTVIYRVMRFVWRGLRWFFRGLGGLLRALPLIWKTVLVVLAAAVGTGLMIAPDASETRAILWLILVAVLVPLVLVMAVSLRRLQKGVQLLAAGDMDSRVDTAYLFGELRATAETINRVGDGMRVAVDERMKSERMKTELITNVSHDIKTPLTSIINYVDLLKKEQPESETMREYLEVLDRQSARLKKLIEDLVEASKASTGNLPVELHPCEAGILLTQMMGEYEERAAAQQLTLHLAAPEQPVMIPADGRHLSRVFDNLMNNICKYSQPATRVYLSLEQVGTRAVITFRNISRAPLNISGDELMERFVRGDSSRNTEGSGLGLSIAKSLTELQGGTLDLLVDGDLFKVVLTFTVCQDPPPSF